jgi:hypothetical protein
MVGGHAALSKYDLPYDKMLGVGSRGSEIMQ